MSENLDLVRSIYADWERGDFGSAEWADPDIEFSIAGYVDDRTWTGLDGMAAGGRYFLAPWEDFRVEAEEFRELDDERVLVLDNQKGRGKTSRVELGRFRGKGATLWQIRDGMVTRLALYPTRDRALADLGLKE